jgi:hypothetical protein
MFQVITFPFVDKVENLFQNIKNKGILSNVSLVLLHYLYDIHNILRAKNASLTGKTLIFCVSKCIPKCVKMYT